MTHLADGVGCVSAHCEPCWKPTVWESAPVLLAPSALTRRRWYQCFLQSEKTHLILTWHTFVVVWPQSDFYHDSINLRTHVSDKTTKWRAQWNRVANIQMQQREELGWPLPSSSITPLPRSSSVDSLVEPSFKNSVKISPVWGEEQVTIVYRLWSDSAVCSGSTRTQRVIMAAVNQTVRPISI